MVWGKVWTAKYKGNKNVICRQKSDQRYRTMSGRSFRNMQSVSGRTETGISVSVFRNTYFYWSFREAIEITQNTIQSECHSLTNTLKNLANCDLLCYWVAFFAVIKSFRNNFLKNFDSELWVRSQPMSRKKHFHNCVQLEPINGKRKKSTSHGNIFAPNYVASIVVEDHGTSQSSCLFAKWKSAIYKHPVRFPCFV